ncbi:transcription elongation factor TFIIS [Paramarasmius palmivorus]|uniref:Transcription elongation factor TFIIS n=1 Tax=Paramarasmius palmivorus TaxID=297713 RepID=A0AAW0D826_9AGAR
MDPNAPTSEDQKVVDQSKEESSNIGAEDLPTVSLNRASPILHENQSPQETTEKIQQENSSASLGAEEQQAETDAFQCARCKQRKCRYRQAQTRSADEPMTTFVTCINCGNKWRFS